MMKDQWKDILAKNKDRIQEDFELPVGHEQRFRAKLDQTWPAQHKKTHYWRVAAVLIPLMMISIYYLTKPQPVQNTKQPAVNLAAYSSQLSNAKNHLTYLIQTNVGKIKAAETTGNQKIVRHALTELKKLQTDYNHLLHDLQASGGNKRVMKAIVTNLQLQVKILQAGLQQIDLVQKLKNNPHETVL